MFAASARTLAAPRRPDERARPPAAMGAIMDGEAQPSQMAALLMALALKGERPGRNGRLRARDARARACRCREPSGDVFDTCGTGGDGAHTFNVSTAAAIVLAGAGVRVAKHGNRAVSSRVRQRRRVRGARRESRRAAGCGRRRRSSDAGPRVLLCADVASVDAPRRADAPRTRRAHGVQPARAADESGRRRRGSSSACRVRSTPSWSRARSARSAPSAPGSCMARAASTSSRRSGHTKVSELRGGTVNTFYVHPADAGLPLADRSALAGGTAAENAAMIERLLDGETGPAPRRRAAQRRARRC